jgi:lia operon protein LiaG
MEFKNKWNSKKIVIYLLATVFITYGLGAIILFSSPRIFNHENYSYNTDDEKSIGIVGISNINVNVSSSEINILPSESSEVKAHYYGNVTSSSSYPKPELECYANGDTIYINVKNKNVMTFGFFSSNLKLDITIPASYSNNLKLASSSGSINVKDLKLKKLDCALSSGSTNINQVSSDEFIYACSSGSLNAENLITKTTRLDSSSGKQKLLGFSGDLKSTSSSGSIQVEYASFNNNININASSGSVSVKLPESSTFYLDASASSGSIRSAFPITVTGGNNKHALKGTVGSDKNKISIHSSSGSISIEN